MFTKAQQEAIERLNAYLQNAGEEELAADREAVAAWQDVGPTWDTYLHRLTDELTPEFVTTNQVRTTMEYLPAGAYTSKVKYRKKYNQPSSQKVEEAEAIYGHEY